MTARPVLVLRRELPKLDGDLANRSAAIKNLKVCALELDAQTISLFVAGVSEAIDNNPSLGEDVILLFEEIARAHGPKIIPSIDTIMSTIMKILSSSADSCSRVVAAIGRYGIDPLTPEVEKTRIICSLCQPLSDALMGFEGSVSLGAAVCLKTLLNLDNWQFASNCMVNEVCLKVTGLLEETQTRTSSHIDLVIALAKHNSWILEAYAMSIIKSGLQILSDGLQDKSSQDCCLAIQMIDHLMKSVDKRSISSEIVSIVEIMEKCRVDRSLNVQVAAFETLQTANMLAEQERSRNELYYSPLKGSGFARISEGDAPWVVADDGAINNPPSHDSKSLISHSIVSSSKPSELSSHRFQCVRLSSRRVRNADIDSTGGPVQDGFFQPVFLHGDSSMNCLEHHKLHEHHEEPQEFFSASTECTHCRARNALAETPYSSPKRSWPVDFVKVSPTSRKILSIQSSHSSSAGNFDMLDHEYLNFFALRDDAVGQVPNTVDYKGVSLVNRRSIREQLIRNDENRADNAGLQSFAGNDIVNDSLQTCRGVNVRGNDSDHTVILRKKKFCKASIGFILNLSLIFLAIILFVWSRNSEDLFSVVPT